MSEARLAACQSYRDDPLGFVRDSFPWGTGALAGLDGPAGWQAALLEDIGAALRGGAPVRMATASGHGVGKTAVCAWLTLWFLSTRADPQVVVTAGTENQLRGKTWRELAKWLRLLAHGALFRLTADRLSLIGAERTWFAQAVPWNRARGDAFAGTHERHVMMLYDEASAIDDTIWDVTEGAMATPGALWLVFGNPTRADGRFAECFGRFAHRWTTRHVDARDCGRADAAQIGRWIEDYGLDSDFVRMRVTGQFPRASSERFVPADLVAQARQRAALDPRAGPLLMGVDVARFGDDHSVALLRRGDRVLALTRWHRLDTMQLAAQVSGLINSWRPVRVFVDGVGVGGGVVDRLRQLGHQVVEVNAGARARDDRRFANLRAEMWSAMRDWLVAGGALPVDDEALAREIATPGYGFDPRNRLRLEGKDELRARGDGSPDAADALALTFAAPVSGLGAGAWGPGGWEADPFLFPRQTRTEGGWVVFPGDRR
ncbi:MAG: terminase [Rhodospirillales bacterium]|nr:MAG: terminase [Rhodospirillales bacterium]